MVLMLGALTRAVFPHSRHVHQAEHGRKEDDAARYGDEDADNRHGQVVPLRQVLHSILDMTTARTHAYVTI